MIVRREGTRETLLLYTEEVEILGRKEGRKGRYMFFPCDTRGRGGLEVM